MGMNLQGTAVATATLEKHFVVVHDLVISLAMGNATHLYETHRCRYPSANHTLSLNHRDDFRCPCQQGRVRGARSKRLEV
jgi:hypothetical protein